MNRKNSRWTAALAATLLVQIAAFAWLIVRYERVASGGTVCRFACEAYDPSDPFRGRYLHIRVRNAWTMTRRFAWEASVIPIGCSPRRSA